MVYFDHGTTPRSVLDTITSRRAFIYALEVYAQLMAFFALAERLPSDWLAFIDNTAGEAALKKGYGKDAFVNGMLATFWAWRPQFARVKSKANVADAVSWGLLPRTPRGLDKSVRRHRRHHLDPGLGGRGRQVRRRARRGRSFHCSQLSRHGVEGRGRRAGVQSAPCPVPPSFVGGRRITRSKRFLASKKTFRSRAAQ